MNLLRWKFALLLSFCLVGGSYALPGYDIVEAVESFVSPSEAVELLATENAQIQSQVIALKNAGKKEEAWAFRLKGKVYSDLSYLIQQTDNVERAFATYFNQGSAMNSHSALTKMTTAQIASVKAEVDALLRK